MSNRTHWFFPDLAPEQRTHEVQGFMAVVEEKMGFIPNVFKAFAWRPTRLLAWWAHYVQLKVPTERLTDVEREMIAVVVSSINSCTYCNVSHGAALREASGDPVFADRVAVNWRHAGLTELQYGVCEFVEKLTLRPAVCGENDLLALADLGLSQEEVWDVIEITSMFAFTNRMALATGLIPNKEYFGAHRCGKTLGT